MEWLYVHMPIAGVDIFWPGLIILGVGVGIIGGFFGMGGAWMVTRKRNRVSRASLRPLGWVFDMRGFSGLELRCSLCALGTLYLAVLTLSIECQLILL